VFGRVLQRTRVLKFSCKLFIFIMFRSFFLVLVGYCVIALIFIKNQNLRFGCAQPLCISIVLFIHTIKENKIKLDVYLSW